MRNYIAIPPVFLTFLMILAGLGPALGETMVLTGEIREFNGPDDLELDPNRVVVAVDVFGDQNRMVNGVLFQTDKSPPADVSVTASNSINNWATRPSYSGADSVSTDNLEEIMQDIRWEGAPNPVRVDVSGLTPGIEYELQMLFNEGADRNRRWDIAIEGELAVDDFTSEGEGTWSSSNGFAYIAPFSLAAGDTTLNVEMKQHIGGQPAVSGDNNPILQAFTITEVTVPPTPDSLAFSPTQFFAAQTAAIGSLLTTDLKRNATHLYSFSDSGGADNDKFEIDDDLILPGPYDFSAHGPGTTFDVRVRTTDAEDPARFLEQDFTLTLVQAQAPTAVALSAPSISSGAIVDTPVGQLTTTDPNAVDAHTYALVAGAGDLDNGLFSIDGVTLRVAAPIPSGRTLVQVRIRTTDLAGLTTEQSFTLAVTAPSLRINELMASNGTTLTDENGDHSDWVEIFNEQSAAANLNGWYLTDDLDDLTKWEFPAVTIAANDFLVIFASGKNRKPTDGSNLHTNYQLDSGGERLALVGPDGLTIASQIEFPDQHTDVSYGHNSAATEVGFLQAATPGEPNGEIAAQIVNAVIFSHERGMYDNEFELTLTPSIPGSTIRYTTNGQKPTASSGSIYTDSIVIRPETSSTIRGTRRVRAIAIHPTAAITPVATHTYLFLEGTSRGTPDTNGVLGQGLFRTQIKDHSRYGPLMLRGLQSLPVVSIVKPSGISASEAETSIELISQDGSEPGFQIDCGIKIVGGASVGSQKNNFRCYFRSQYGSGKLRYPLFANHPYTKGASEEFDVIQLRGGSHDNFYWMARLNHPPSPFRDADALYIRNRFTWDAEMLMGQPSIHGRWTHCYLNGAYHGIYQIHERPMHHWMDKYFGGDPEDYHYTNSARTGSDHGGGDNWSATWQQVKSAAGGAQSRNWINWESLADNQLLYFYFGNDWDWSANHNWMAAGPRRRGQGGWRFYSWDCDVSMYDVNENNLGRNAPDGVFTAMMRDEDFEVFFRDRIYKHCFNDGVLNRDGLRAAFDFRVNEIFDAIVPESARWQPADSRSPPWDRDGEWQTELDYMNNTYWPRRAGILLDQFRARGWWPVEPPEFNPHGGEIDPGFSPAIDGGSGTIYVTTDGTDPRLPGGAANPNALALTGSSVTTAVVPAGAAWKYLDDGSDQGTAWREGGFNDAGWAEGNAELGYGDGDEATVVSFGPDPGNRPITTYFRKTFQVADAAAVSGLLLQLVRDDGAMVYLNGTEVWRSNMPEGVITSQTPAFEGVRAPEESTFFAKNDVSSALLVEGENVLAVEVHQIISTSSDISFNCSLSVTRPSDPDQFRLNESTLVKARVKEGNEWSALSEVVFTIGDAANSTNLVMSELSYRPAGPSPAEDPTGIYSRTDYEFVELMNISNAPIHLKDVRLTDGIGFDFAGNPMVGLDPGEQILLVEDLNAFLLRYPAVSPDRIAGEFDGNLSNDGERIEILGEGDAVIRDFTYNDKAPWPEAADGDGYTLELINPLSNPDHAVATNWRASRGIHGTPVGIWSAFDFADWQLLNFTSAELADPVISGPNADQEGDGLTNFAEFAQGTAPDDLITRTMLPAGTVVEEGGEAYLAITYQEWLGALGVTHEIQLSTNLLTWQSGPAVTVEVGSPIDNGDGTITRTFRSSATRVLYMKKSLLLGQVLDGATECWSSGVVE